MSELSREDIDRVVDGVATMERSLERLIEKRDTTDKEAYLADPDTRDIVERRFVKLIEAAIDIGTIIIRSERKELPESNPATMGVLIELDVIERPQ